MSALSHRILKVNAQQNCFLYFSVGLYTVQNVFLDFAPNKFYLRNLK
ncbi:hypothetical protein CLV81_3983 [Flagellimonas meridianipacifica]|uniref:Uncharacterized protein n=1 Tax=Flagellimonas meridianipacifica TaxID=1080225 RepID=A0A2T0M6M1_9FLAO|nr:hypothetical protein CLV81_3983 [Allomuricauda pacifica]